MGAGAIGGGEWLLGPLVTAKYGAGLLWLATLSILFQGIYNVEISRYTLYCGEPIFSGKLRTLPGPGFWVFVYLLLDFGSVFPYLAANAATPVAILWRGGSLPDPAHIAADWWLVKIISSLILVIATIPLLVGGKIYDSIRAVMTFKLVVVIGFLSVVAVFYSHFSSWREILTGFVEFGNVPVQLSKAQVASGEANVQNVFLSWFHTGRLPEIEWQLVAEIMALAAIAGNGGLSNAPISNYTRDQGWGMGHAVGAIPSMVAGHSLELSHVGKVFEVTPDSLVYWRGWVRHVVRDQWAVWVPACFIGVALPSMLSVEFMPRGTTADKWNVAALTAVNVGKHTAAPAADVLASTSGLAQFASGPTWGNCFWGMTLFCGFIVLATGMLTGVDGLIRRWVDVFWTASPAMRQLDSSRIRHVYFCVLMGYLVFGMVMLWVNEPIKLINFATLGFNFALGVSCWHTLAVNHRLLPRPLRPGWKSSLGLIIGGVFFTLLGAISSYKVLSDLGLVS